MAAGLLDAAGDQLENLDKIPIRGRPSLAIYLGLLERDDDVKVVLSSMSPAELRTLPGIPYYHVASELLGHGKCLRTAIWAWKKGAEMRGGADLALVCPEIMQACARLDGAEALREHFIPWAEKALAQPGSETLWQRALPGLLRTYSEVGQPDKAVERGQYWLHQARRRDVSPDRLIGARVRLAQALAMTGEVQQAADALRQVIPVAPGAIAEFAQAELVKLSQAHPDIREVAILPPHLHTVQPREIAVWLRAGETKTETVTAAGNATLLLTGASCDLPWVSPALPAKHVDELGSRCDVQVTIGPVPMPGHYSGALSVEANDGTRTAIPLVVHSFPPMRVERPGGFWFGTVQASATKTASLVVTCPSTATIMGGEVEAPDFLTLDVTKQDNKSYLLKATLRAPERTGYVEGTIKLKTDSEVQPALRVPFSLRVE